MKAYYEFPAPKSCIECGLSAVVPAFSKKPVCVVLYDEHGGGEIDDKIYYKPNDKRAPFCPLRIEDTEPCEHCNEAKEKVINRYSKADNMRAWGYICCPYCARKLAERIDDK